ncbi:hypothetical protein BaRGS_00020874 [Batillaria attramentaria]|uniref:SGNH hydrolase-type esterase domain-containing protein n=1 Tax=Batillaria attramentaria TaxID=370345 RepID=A0ABD0KLG3_9CAEN
MASEHQLLHDPTDWSPILQEKKDFKQVSFVVPKHLLPTARKVLSARYRHLLASLPLVEVEWEDWNTDRNRFVIDNEDDDLTHFSDSLPHPDLYQNTCRVWSEGTKIITLQTYYTTGTILAQGTECVLWRRDEFKNLSKVIAKVYNHFSQTKGIGDHTFHQDIESLALPDAPKDINNREATKRGLTPLGSELTPESDEEDQSGVEGVNLSTIDNTPLSPPDDTKDINDDSNTRNDVTLDSLPPKEPASHPPSPTPCGPSAAQPQCHVPPTPQTGTKAAPLLPVERMQLRAPPAEDGQLDGDTGDAKTSDNTPCIPAATNTSTSVDIACRPDTVVGTHSPDHPRLNPGKTTKRRRKVRTVYRRRPLPNPPALVSPTVINKLKQLDDAICNLKQQHEDVKSAAQTKLDDMRVDIKKTLKLHISDSIIDVSADVDLLKKEVAMLGEERHRLDKENKRLKTILTDQRAEISSLRKLVTGLQQSRHPSLPLSQVSLPADDNVSRSDSSQNNPPTAVPNTCPAPPTTPTAATDGVTSTAVEIQVPTQNSFEALSDMNGEEPIEVIVGRRQTNRQMVPDTSKLTRVKRDSNCEEKQVHTVRKASNQHPKSTPRAKLDQHKIKSDTQYLFIGDSVIGPVNPKRLECDVGAPVQCISVPGLEVSELLDWLHNLPTTQCVKTVAVHVGVNTCKNTGAKIETSLWKKLIVECRTTFPNGRILLSSVVPAFGRNTLNQTIAPSNTALRTVCKSEKVILVDHFHTFITETGAPRKALYRDAIHPSILGVERLVCNLLAADQYQQPASRLRRSAPKMQSGDKQAACPPPLNDKNYPHLKSEASVDLLTGHFPRTTRQQIGDASSTSASYSDHQKQTNGPSPTSHHYSAAHQPGGPSPTSHHYSAAHQPGGPSPTSHHYSAAHQPGGPNPTSHHYSAAHQPGGPSPTSHHYSVAHQSNNSGFAQQHWYPTPPTGPQLSTSHTPGNSFQAILWAAQVLKNCLP